MGAANTHALIGRLLHDTYRLTRLVGQGGMGAVFEAVHARLAKKRFAVKLLLPSLTAVPEVFARFRREAEIVTELGHPHIVDVIDFNETDDGLPYMVMEFLEGEDLDKRLKRELRLSSVGVAQLVTQIGSALQAAHDHGVVHRDMKPDNVFLLGPRGAPIHVKLLDFGISKIRHSTALSSVTRDHQILGTPTFMSPEQAEGGAKDVDHRSDIFALGSITYLALSGQLPFAASTVLGVLYQVCATEPRPLPELVPDLPPSVQPVLARALAKNKDDRYQRVEEFARDLVAALDCGAQAAALVPGPLLEAPTVPAPPPEPAVDAVSPMRQSRPATATVIRPSFRALPENAPDERPAATASAKPAGSLTTLSTTAAEMGASPVAAASPTRRIGLVLVAGAVIAAAVPIGLLLVRGRSGRRSALVQSAASPPAPRLDAGNRSKVRSDAISAPSLPSLPARAAPRVDAAQQPASSATVAAAKKRRVVRSRKVAPAKKLETKSEKRHKGPLFDDLRDEGSDL